jgi:Ca-activated chloride channel homolog
MSPQIVPMTDTELDRLPAADDDAGLGALRTGRGNLPLESLDLRTGITGLLARTQLTQVFQNPHDEPVEATYVFPLPDRAAVAGMRMIADGRTIEARLSERAAAREAYQRAVTAGQRASIAEQERPDVFTMRVGNILPGERVTVILTLAGPLSYEDDQATFRFPLVVAPRYIPGTPLPGDPVGEGYAADTDAVPDASRITPPVLLPGFPHPVRLGIEVALDPGGLRLDEARSSMPLDRVGDGVWRLRPGQRADRDFVLRLRYESTGQTLVTVPDDDGDEGTFQLVVVPPPGATSVRPRDVVLVLDRSGSMRGWKMVAARRAAARIVDTLTSTDRFAVFTFDNMVEQPPTLATGLIAATDRHRFRAVEHLAAVAARGGTELLGPLREALALLAGSPPERDPVLVLVTDGQVGNEDQILAELDAGLAGVRVHTVGIDQAVNAGFLGRLASAGSGRCELVESEDRLDEAMDRIHHRISAPVVSGIGVTGDGFGMLADTLAPARIPDLFPGAPLVLTGRYQGPPGGGMLVAGTAADGSPWHTRLTPTTVDNPALPSVWARAHLRDLEDRYLTAGRGGPASDLERRMVATSLRFSVLCRFTGYVAVDTRTVTGGGEPHRVVQPVEPAAGWDMLAGQPAWAPAPSGVAPPGPVPVSAVEMEAARMGAAPASAMGGLSGLLRRRARAGGAPRAGGAQSRATGRAEAVGTPHPPLDHLTRELSLLREAGTAPEDQRRQVLADLVSRLLALLDPLRPHATGGWARLLTLLDTLRDDTVRRLPSDQFTARWKQVVALLAELAPEPSGQRPGSMVPPEPEPRREFWKRT